MRQTLARWYPVADIPSSPVYDFALESCESGKATLILNYCDIVGNDGRNLTIKFSEVLALRIHWDGDSPVTGKLVDAPRCPGDRHPGFIWPLLMVVNSEWFASGDFDTSRAIAEGMKQIPWAQFSVVTLERSIDILARGTISADCYLGAYMAFFKIPRRRQDDNWAYTVNGIGGTFITLRPGNEKETTVLITFLKRDQNIEGDKPAARKQLLLQALKGRGTVADRVSADLDTVQDFYFGPMGQVKASTWSKGRFVLLGDAAYCPTPFTGEGTALALVGAYVLAGEIKRGAGYAEAFGAYEGLLRPYVETSQKRLSPRFIRLLHVKTPFGIGLTRLAQKFFASKAVQKLFKPSAAKREKDVAEDFVFPSYS